MKKLSACVASYLFLWPVQQECFLQSSPVKAVCWDRYNRSRFNTIRSMLGEYPIGKGWIEQ